MSSYPSPRYPKLKRPKTVEELMPKARKLVNQPPGHVAQALKPSYGIKPRDKILFVVLSEYDPTVIAAMCQAIREKKARVDLLTLDSTPVAPPEELAVHEAISIGKDEDDYNYFYTGICNLLRPATARRMVESEKYTMLIGGTAGPTIPLSVPWHKFNFTRLEDFAGPMWDMPLDLVSLINQKAWAQIVSSKVLRLTDPEGTDIKWTNYDDKRRYIENHLLARPWHIGYNHAGKDDCTGIVAGTLNHLGAFPHIKAHIEGGQVIKIEGGGKYGEVWREKLEEYKNVKFPPAPLATDVNTTFEIKDPGFFWYFEGAIGTLPCAFRSPREGLFQCFGNFLRDRWRAGYIHNGFGSSAYLPSVGQRESIQARIPWIHIHIHSMFATLEGTTSKGESVIIIDKGHLKALDDPEVRTLASKYDNPDKLLKEIWFPAVPGINAPGDYMKDYAQSPIPWIKREATEHPLWID